MSLRISSPRCAPVAGSSGTLLCGEARAFRRGERLAGVSKWRLRTRGPGCGGICASAFVLATRRGFPALATYLAPGAHDILVDVSPLSAPLRALAPVTIAAAAAPAAPAAAAVAAAAAAATARITPVRATCVVILGAAGARTTTARTYSRTRVRFLLVEPELGWFRPLHKALAASALALRPHPSLSNPADPVLS